MEWTVIDVAVLHAVTVRFRRRSKFPTFTDYTVKKIEERTVFLCHMLLDWKHICAILACVIHSFLFKAPSQLFRMLLRRHWTYVIVTAFPTIL